MTCESPDAPGGEALIALIEALEATIAALEAQVAGLQARVAIIPELEAQAAIIPALLQEIAELRRRLGQDSSNSSKPPSSDGLKKPPAEKAQRRTRSLREKSGRQTAGQPGHKGATLKQTDKPDAVIDHYPKTCGGCGAPLPEGSSEGYVRRQQIDLPPPPPPVVTEHRAHGCRCGNCGTKTQASFPEGINAPVQYGPRIRAIVAYLLNKEHFPEDRLEQAMSVLFGLQICSATIASFSRSCASRLEAFANALRDLVCTAPVKHMDETGFRVGARTQWLHVACTTLLTFYRVSNRGSLLQGVLGIIVHDHWKTYYTMPGVLNALCNAHHLRELKALVEIEKEEGGVGTPAADPSAASLPCRKSGAGSRDCA